MSLIYSALTYSRIV